ncbi:MAG: DUF86 domain-containing protein [Mycoplasma sp.]|nr:DUF86 domain-containing protein [Candidatus Hennigella equi]
MDNIKTDKYYLSKIEQDLEIIIENSKTIKLSKLKIDTPICDSILFRIIQVSENAESISTEFKKKFSTIPWREIKGMRNRIVHEYGDVDLEIIKYTITKDIPVLLKKIKKIKK